MDIETKLKIIGPYGVRVSRAMLGLGEAVELVLNLRDYAVLREMKSVCDEVFQQAEKAIQDDKARGVQ